MIEMAYEFAHRATSCAVAAGTTAVGGLLAAARQDETMGQIGVSTSIIGATYLIIQVVREAGPTLLKWSEIRANNANTLARLGEANAEIASLKARVAAAEQEARDARNEVENAKVAADARAAALELKVRETGHMVRNNSQKIADAGQRIEQVEKAVGGSGDRDPEVAI
jgi:hypothetical protein